jgi:mono/diheme cytochrome c family protein
MMLDPSSKLPMIVPVAAEKVPGLARRALRGIVPTAAAALFLSVSSALAQTADPSDIAEGGRLFRQKANCQSCHGWAGDGRKMDTQMPDGANLRESKLNRQDLVMTIKCGRPGTGMPAFDKFAYSDGRCYGLKQSDLRASGQRMPDPAATATAARGRHDRRFLVSEGRQPGLDESSPGASEFWESDAEPCREFPN